MRTGERFGTEHLTNVLIGDDSDAVLKFGHDCLPTFGVGKEYGKQEWRSIFRQLYGAGIIALDITGHGTWSVTDAGRRVLKGADKVTLRKDTLKPATKKTARAAANAAALADGEAGDTALFEALRQRRSALAKEQRVAAYVVFADKTPDRHGAAQAGDSRRDGRRARRRRSKTAAIRRYFPRRDPAARGGPSRIIPGAIASRAKPRFCRGFAMLHPIPRYVSNATIFAGFAGFSARSSEYPSPA